MQSKLNPYISFKNSAREAMEFYKSVFGGKLTMSTFKEFQMAHDPSDTPKDMGYTDGKRISISLSGDNEEELKGYWDKLSVGGKVNMPLNKAPWGDSFGMLTDKFGIDWMVNITGKKA